LIIAGTGCMAPVMNRVLTMLKIRPEKGATDTSKEAKGKSVRGEMQKASEGEERGEKEEKGNAHTKEVELCLCVDAPENAHRRTQEKGEKWSVQDMRERRMIRKKRDRDRQNVRVGDLGDGRSSVCFFLLLSLIYLHEGNRAIRCCCCWGCGLLALLEREERRRRARERERE